MALNGRGGADKPKVAVLCGGVGAARILRGLVQLLPHERLTAIVNVGDDFTLHGLHISPDIDTIVYTLADQVSVERGWGLTDETWKAMETLDRYGGQSWFSLGDRDLGTHLFRTQRLREGADLTKVTDEIAQAWGLPLAVLPATCDELRTIIATDQYGDLSFQEYFVRHRHEVTARSVRFDGQKSARPEPKAVAALEDADLILIAPSNPVVSIDPILAIPGYAELLERRRSDVCAISPIVAGKAIKGPAARLLVEMDGAASAVGVAKWYQRYCSTLVVDTADATSAQAISDLGVSPVVCNTIMADLVSARALAASTLATWSGPTSP